MGKEEWSKVDKTGDTDGVYFLMEALTRQETTNIIKEMN